MTFSPHDIFRRPFLFRKSFSFGARDLRAKKLVQAEKPRDLVEKSGCLLEAGRHVSSAYWPVLCVGRCGPRRKTHRIWEYGGPGGADKWGVLAEKLHGPAPSARSSFLGPSIFSHRKRPRRLRTHCRTDWQAAGCSQIVNQNGQTIQGECGSGQARLVHGKDTYKTSFQFHFHAAGWRGMA